MIWGLAFVAQRISAQHIGAFTYNGLRFFLGFLTLVPVYFFLSLRRKIHNPEKKLAPASSAKQLLFASSICGIFLFGGINMQQLGLIWTSAGKGAFLTSFYIVLVPLGALLRGIVPSRTFWLGLLVSVLGLYFLSVTKDFRLAPGDIFQLIGAAFWTCHIFSVAHFSQKCDALKLAMGQYLFCAVFSLLVGLCFEQPNFDQMKESLVSLLYTGIASVGIAYTLQIFGQKYLPPRVAVFILCLEAVFAALSAWLILRETLSLKEGLGCILLLSGPVIAQISELSGTQEPETKQDT